MKHLKRIFESIDNDLVVVQNEFSRLADETNCEIKAFPDYISIQMRIILRDPSVPRFGSIESIEELNRFKDLFSVQNNNLSILKNVLHRLQKHGYEFFIPSECWSRWDYLEIRILRNNEGTLLDALYSKEKDANNEYRLFEPNETTLRAILKNKFGLKLLSLDSLHGGLMFCIDGDQEQNTDLIENLSKIVSFVPFTGARNGIKYLSQGNMTMFLIGEKK